jgi:hypothetical protein
LGQTIGFKIQLASVWRISIAFLSNVKWSLSRDVRVPFFCLAKRKETKEKATPLPLVSFGLSAASGRLRNSRFSAQTVLAAYPSAAQAEGAARGFKVKTH